MDKKKLENIVSDLKNSSVREIIPYDFVNLEEGRVEMSMEPQANQLQSMGFLQGGVVCAVLDAAAGYAAYSTTDTEDDMVAQEITVHFLRPAIPTEGTLYCVGEVLKRGRKVTVSESCLYANDKKTLLAKLVGSYVPVIREK